MPSSLQQTKFIIAGNHVLHFEYNLFKSSLPMDSILIAILVIHRQDNEQEQVNKLMIISEKKNNLSIYFVCNLECEQRGKV